MPAIILCPQCQRRLRLPDDYQGEELQCPACRADFLVDPDTLTASPVTAAPAAPRPKSPAPRPDREPAKDDEDRPRDRRDSRRPRWDRPRSPRPAARKSSGAGWVIALVILGALGLCAVLGVLVIAVLAVRRAASPPPLARVQENKDEQRQEVRQALGKQQPLTEKELAQELKPLFEDLGGALAAANADRIMARFDVERMTDELGPLAGLPAPTTRQWRDFTQGLRQGLANSLTRPGAPLAWKASEIRSVKKLNDDEAVVIVRHQHPNGNTLKMRWWVSRRSGGWKVYDMEDLNLGMRLSVLGASAAAQALDNHSDTMRALKTLTQALQAAGQQDLDGAEKKLRQIEGVRLPAQFDAVRLLLAGALRLQRGQAAAALEALDKAHALRPDMPALDFLKGRAFNQLGQWDRALKHLEAYRDLIGEDAEVCRELGYALRGKGHFPDAVRAYRKSLDLNPKDPDAFLGFLQALGGDDPMDDVGARLLKLDNRRQNFDICAEDCEDRNFPQLLEPLVLAMRQVDPAYASVDYYQALVKAQTGHADEAVPLFKAALARQANAEARRAYGVRFLQVMSAAGKGADAYAVVPDAHEAFHFLASEAVKHYRTEELKQLIAAHRKGHADDPSLPLYQAQVYVQEGRYALAEKTFAAALLKPPGADTLAEFRAGRVLARYHTGGALSAYREIGPRDDTFRQLARLAFQDDDDTLQRLLDEHAKNDPKSILLARYRYRLKVRQGRVDEGIALFKAAVAEPLPDAEREEMVSEFLDDLVSAGKPLEGYRAAPDAVEAFQIVAGELLDEGHMDDLRRLVEAHRAGHPTDPWLALYQGDIDLADKAWDRAVRVLGEGMKRAPKDLRESFHWKYVFALYRAGRWKQAYEEVEPRGQTFTNLADLMAGDKHAADLEALCKAHQVHAADDADLLYYQALAKLFAKQPGEAAALLQQAYQKQVAEARRSQYVSRFLHEMQGQGLVIEGYRAAPDKSAAFQTLAPQLVYQKKDKELAALLAEHERGREADPLCEFFQGELHLLRGEADKAEPHFAAALARGTPRDQWRFRNGLFRARVKAGKAAATYPEVEPGPATFEALAALCVQEKDARQLQALIDANHKAHPDDANVPAWELEVKWLNQDYDGVLKLLAEHREDVFDLPRFRWKANDYRVRALVKLKRTGDAIREAEAVAKRRSGNSVLLVLAHAAAGDVKQTIAALERQKPEPYLVRSCYQDADLGPILRGEAFGAFRQKFPEPKDEPVANGLGPDEP
jgi:predicted Zn-dependent protease